MYSIKCRNIFSTHFIPQGVGANTGFTIVLDSYSSFGKKKKYFTDLDSKGNPSIEIYIF